MTTFSHASTTLRYVVTAAYVWRLRLATMPSCSGQPHPPSQAPAGCGTTPASATGRAVALLE